MKDSIHEYILGEDPKLQTVLDSALESGDTIVIAIKDPNGTISIDDASMSQVTERVYQYIYSTETTGVEGMYEATIKVTASGNDDYDRIYFIMNAYS